MIRPLNLLLRRPDRGRWRLLLPCLGITQHRKIQVRDPQYLNVVRRSAPYIGRSQGMHETRGIGIGIS